MEEGERPKRDGEEDERARQEVKPASPNILARQEHYPGNERHVGQPPERVEEKGQPEQDPGKQR